MEAIMAEAAVKLPVHTRNEGKAERPAGATAVGPIETLRRQVDHLFEDFLRGYWHLPFTGRTFDVEPLWRGEVTFGATPAVDIVEKDDVYKVTAELPGMDVSNIDVKFANGALTITGEKTEEKEEKKQDYFLSERRFGSFRRSFRVSDGVDPDKIEASFKNGVLTVTLPKTEQARQKQKTISVQKA
jgi:HSP20 family protein